MKWAWIIAGGLAGLVALVAIIGSLLPRGHKARGSARFKQSPESVWAAITDYAGQVQWRAELKSVERDPDQEGKPVWREIQKNGDALPLATIEEVPGKRLVRKIADPSLPFSGTWTYELQAAEGGCVLTITEDGEVSNPIFRFVARVFMDPSATLRGYLAALGRKFGEDASVEIKS
jgi:uncharacterized protein YndB with AHSA1/START domain